MSAQQPRSAFTNRKTLCSRRALVRGLLGGVAAGVASRMDWLDNLALAEQGVHMIGEPVAFGAYLPDALWEPDVLVQYAATIHRKPDFLVWYASWADGEFGDDQRE